MSNSTTADPGEGDPEADGTDSRNPLGGVRRSLDPAIDPLLGVLVAIRRSFVLFVAAVGVVLIAIGVLIEGLFAGMFGIWGATALVCAGLAFAVVQLLKLLDA